MGSRSLAALRRALPGDPLTYRVQDVGVHEVFLQAAADIPKALTAQRELLGNLMTPTLERELTERAVNRMRYRLNLEIQDRMLTAVCSHGIVKLARKANLPASLVESVRQMAEDGRKHAALYRKANQPTADNLEPLMAYGARMTHLRHAVSAGDAARVAAVCANAPPEDWIAGMHDHYRVIWENAAEVAAMSETSEILDGAQEFHLPFAELGLAGQQQRKARVAGKERWQPPTTRRRLRRENTELPDGRRPLRRTVAGSHGTKTGDARGNGRRRPWRWQRGI